MSYTLRDAQDSPATLVLRDFPDDEIVATYKVMIRLRNAAEMVRRVDDDGPNPFDHALRMLRHPMTARGIGWEDYQ